MEIIMNGHNPMKKSLTKKGTPRTRRPNGEPRELISQVLAADPAATALEIVRQTGLTKTTVYKHCKVLRKRGAVARTNQVFNEGSAVSRLFPPPQELSTDEQRFVATIGLIGVARAMELVTKERERIYTIMLKGAR